MGNIKDRTGQKFNKWTVLSFHSVNNNREAVWNCHCDCGHEQPIVASNLISGGSRQCINCRLNQNYTQYVLPPPVWAIMVKNSRHNREEIKLTREFAETLFIKQKGLCALTGQSIRFAHSNKESKLELQTASLDRIDSSKTYTENNVHWVHKEINIMKNKYSLEKFIENCKLVVDHHGEQTN